MGPARLVCAGTERVWYQAWVDLGGKKSRNISLYTPRSQSETAIRDRGAGDPGQNLKKQTSPKIQDGFVAG